MVRADLIQALLAQHPDLRTSDAQRVVVEFFEQITTRLAAGGRVELRGFGSFTTREHDARVGRDPRNGEPVALGARRIPRFKPVKGLREAVARSAVTKE